MLAYFTPSLVHCGRCDIDWGGQDWLGRRVSKCFCLYMIFIKWSYCLTNVANIWITNYRTTGILLQTKIIKVFCSSQKTINNIFLAYFQAWQKPQKGKWLSRGISPSPINPTIRARGPGSRHCCWRSRSGLILMSLWGTKIHAQSWTWLNYKSKLQLSWCCSAVLIWTDRWIVAPDLMKTFPIINQT